MGNPFDLEDLSDMREIKVVIEPGCYPYFSGFQYGHDQDCHDWYNLHPQLSSQRRMKYLQEVAFDFSWQ